MKPQLIAVLLILVFAGIGAMYATGQFKFEIAQTVDGCEAKTLIPILGRIECEPLSHTPINNEYSSWSQRSGFGWNAWTFFDKCGDDENSRDCSYLFKNPGTNGGLTAIVSYRFCTIGWDESTCGTWSGANINYNGNEVILALNKPLGTIIQVWVDAPIFGGSSSPTLISRYIPYTLNIYDAGGKFRYSTKWCRLDDLNWDTRQNICTTGQGQSGGQFTSCKDLEETTRLEFDDWVNYVAHWAEGPAELNLLTYTDGNKYYCQPGLGNGATLFSLGEIKLESGCYKYPSSPTSIKIDCCPGMKTANAICKDFKWEPILIGDCDLTRPCSTGYECQQNKCVIKAECLSTLDCYGDGDWGVDYSTAANDVVRYACEGGKCVLKERKEVECTPPDVGCRSGYVCSPKDGFKCIKQSGPELKCGDGICSKPYEDEINCAADCKTQPFDFQSWLIPAILGLLGGFIAYLKLEKREKSTRIIGAIIGGIVVAVLVKVILDFIFGIQWWQWLIVGALGGIGIYLFGGAILTVIIILISILKR